MIKEVSNSHNGYLNNVHNQIPTREKTLINDIDQQEFKQSIYQKEKQKEQIEKVVKSMNDFLTPSNTHIKFEFHEKLQEYYVTIINDSTNEVMKEIPQKKFLDMYADITEYLGLLVDKKV